MSLFFSFFIVFFYIENIVEKQSKNKQLHNVLLFVWQWINFKIKFYYILGKSFKFQNISTFVTFKFLHNIFFYIYFEKVNINKYNQKPGYTF